MKTIILIMLILIIACSTEKIPEINSLKDKLFIIATDSIAGFLIKNGITPNCIISIDCQDISYHHLFDVPKEIPVILDITISNIVSKYFKNKIFYCSNHPFAKYLNKYLKLPEIDTTSGNVAHTALNFALTLNPSTIRLYGVDYSYLNGKIYSRDTYIYKYYYNLENKLNPVLSKSLSFIFNNKSIYKNNNTYQTSLLKMYQTNFINFINSFKTSVAVNHMYKINIENKNKTIENKVIINKKPEISNIINSYFDKIKKLPKIDTNFNEYLEKLNVDEKYVLQTLIPLLYFYKNKNNNLIEMFNSVKEYSLEIISKKLKSN